jgi:hypothetical protein
MEGRMDEDREDGNQEIFNGVGEIASKIAFRVNF